MNYYEHHLGDWAAATGHLTWDEDMAYTRLLRAYYHHEQAIAEGQQYRLAKASTPAQRRAVDQVLSEFFELRDGRYHQKRADAEIAKYHEKEPDREAKKENERERQRRARERRKALFDLLREHGVVPAYDAPMSELQTLASRLPSRDVTPPVTRDVTATHTQAPDTIPSRNTTQLTLGPALPPEDRPALTLVGTPDAPQGPPDCPHLAVLALWAEVLPALPQHLPSQWRGTRADHLRARWRETAVEKGWTSAEQGLAYLRRLFAYVGQSEFLSGRSRPQPGKRPFVIELEWLVNPTNWAKVHEGKYHGEAA